MKRVSFSDKLHRCVDHVMDRGYDRSSAFAICRAALGEAEGDLKGGEWLEKVLDVLSRLQKMQEAGRVLSAANEQKLRAAIEQLQAILDMLGTDEQTDEKEAKDKVKEAEKVLDELKAHEIKESFVKLSERALRSDGTMKVKIIAPGWGSSGYYPREVLARDAYKYKSGTKMYWDHPTPSEETERPERSLRDLAGVLVSDGRWEEDVVNGPGIYADIKVFPPFRDHMEELAPYIGISHRATGKAVPGEAEGKTGNIIEGIEEVLSVDFVTEPGAGGKVVQLFESLKNKKGVVDLKWEDITLEELKKHRADLIEALRSEVKSMVYGEKHTLQESLKQKDDEIKQLQEAKEQAETEAKRLKEALVMRDAKEFVTAELAKTDLPEVTKKRLAESLSRSPVLDESGKLDKVKMKDVIDESVKTEAEYLAQAAGYGSIKAMGESEPGNVDVGNIEHELVESFRAIGMSEEAAKQAAKGRI